MHERFHYRWVQHAYKAINTAIIHYDSIVNHLSTEVWNYIRPKSNFDANTQMQALELVNLLENKNYLSSLCFLLDVQDIFRRHSLYYQRKEETLIGQEKRRNQFIGSLIRLKHKKNGGHWTKALLRDHWKMQYAEFIFSSFSWSICKELIIRLSFRCSKTKFFKAGSSIKNLVGTSLCCRHDCCRQWCA